MSRGQSLRPILSTPLGETLNSAYHSWSFKIMSRLKQGNSILKNLFEMLYKILFKIKIVTQEKDYLKFKII